MKKSFKVFLKRLLSLINLELFKEIIEEIKIIIYYQKIFKDYRHNKKVSIFVTLISYILLIPPSTLISKENLFYYEEALKTEKVSSLLSIPLYEEFLKNNPPRKYSEAVIGRLFDLYASNNKYDDLIILTGNYNLDKSRRNRLDEIQKKLSRTYEISYDNLKTICKLAIKNDSNSLNELVEIYNLEKNKYILNFIFAIKLKMNDHNSIKYILDNLTEVNPILRVIYYIKTNSTKVKSSIDEAAKIDNNDEVLKELFYLYGLYLNKNKRFKESIRYHRMSLSYEKDLNISYYPRSSLEISKNLYIKGYSSDACLNIAEKKINIFNESDEFMKIYCDQTRNKELKMIYPVIKYLAKKETNFIFKRFSNENKL